MRCVASKVGNRRRLRNQLAQELKPLSRKVMSEVSYSRNVAARPVQAGDKTAPHGIVAGREDNRYRRRSCLRRICRAYSIGRDDHGHLTADQVGGQCWQLRQLSICPAVFDRHVLALNVAGLFEALTKPGQHGGVRSRRRTKRAEETNHRHRRLLRAPRAAKLPRRCQEA